ncbi:MAG TPA: MBL fold metallo-hydrolase [Longimicrobium sp.]|jgi:glyoxylase-like metal-dependent hydrolase (beta-lactamase superfamily II)|uniref:MBL fold metallo-hydrolase n=1 Tax=Longimicrobium sp. TaxID=2029185 RepID=UPI002EDAC4D7
MTLTGFDLPRPARLLAACLLASVAAAGCTTNVSNIEGPRANAIPTAYPWNSMIYAARTDAGVILVDLGWQNAEDALRRGLAQIGARPEDVTDVFLTHSHRDHIAAWPLVRHARFHVGAGEDALFSGRAGHADSPSRLAEIGIGNPAPWPGEVNVRAFQRDTMFVLGADTVRAFVVPGHTAGSAAYLFRGVLFAGDAVNRSYFTGFRPGFPIFHDDEHQNRASLADLFERVKPYDVQWVCTAHGKCARPDERFMQKVLGRG